MDILFVGQYRDKGIDGKISRDYLDLFLDSGHNVCAIPIHCNPPIKHVGDKAIRAEKNRFEKEPDLVIQSLPPEKIVGTKVKSVGIYNIAQFSRFNTVVDKMDLLDGFIIPSPIKNQEDVYDKLNRASLHYIYPYNNAELESRADEISDLSHTFNFCFMDEYSNMSNIEGLIKAFNSEFHMGENARLIIYSWVDGKSPDESVKIILEDISEIKKGLGIYSKDGHYISDLVITPNLDRPNILQILKQSHCLVVPNRQCFVSQSITDAVSLNKHILMTDKLGIRDFVDRFSTSCDFIEQQDSIAFNNSSLNFPTICSDINPIRLMNRMRYIYEEADRRTLPTKSHKEIRQITINEINDVISTICNK